jgi:hypothetical protein
MPYFSEMHDITNLMNFLEIYNQELYNDMRSEYEAMSAAKDSEYSNS